MRSLLSAASAALLLLATPARAVDVVLSLDVGGCTGAVTGVVECAALDRVGTQVIARWALDVPTGLLGYDFEVRWDPAELSFVSAEQLLPDTGAAVPFVAAPFDPAESSAAAFVIPVPIPPPVTELLFEITFDLVSLVDDGEADVDWFPNGAGLAPSEVVLDNAAGAGIDLVTEATPACRNGLDDDDDDAIDFDGGLLALGYVAAPADPDCNGNPERRRETPSSGSCGVGPELPLLLLPLLAARRRAS